MDQSKAFKQLMDEVQDLIDYPTWGYDRPVFYRDHVFRLILSSNQQNNVITLSYPGQGGGKKAFNQQVSFPIIPGAINKEVLKANIRISAKLLIAGHEKMDNYIDYESLRKLSQQNIERQARAELQNKDDKMPIEER